MFGLEGQKKKKNEEFLFDLENDLKNPKKYQEIKSKIEERLQRLKEALRAGEAHDEYDRLGLLLQGYNAFLKVISRFAKK